MKKFLYTILLFAACSGSEPVQDPTPTPSEAKPFVVDDEQVATKDGMTNEKLDALIKKVGTNVDGQIGFWKFEMNGRMVAVVTDEKANRMRVVTPIAKKSDLEAAVWEVLLEANFHTALDARYATSGDILYSVYLHPLDSLTESDFRSGLSQVVNLAKNFGTSFSSGAMQFN